MSLDTLLSVLFVVVFIVLPLVSRVLQARNRPKAGGRPMPPSAGPPRDAVPPWLAEAQRRVREAQARGSGAPDAPPLVREDPFGTPTVPPASRELVPTDEAPPLAPPVRQGGLVPEDPFEGGLFGPRGDTASPLGREGSPDVARRGTAQRRALAFELGALREIEDVLEAEVGATAVQRGGTRPPASPVGARLGPVGQLRFEREAIVRGLIWHEILDQPAWLRRRGRRSSRLRSR